MNSKQKGKRGELEAVHFLKDLGYEVRRTAQYCGNTGEAADIVGIEGLHLEVKRQETLHIYDWMHQAENDSKGKGIPVVMFRKNNEKWLMCMRAEELMAIWEVANKWKKK